MRRRGPRVRRGMGAVSARHVDQGRNHIDERRHQVTPLRPLLSTSRSLSLFLICSRLCSLIEVGAFVFPTMNKERKELTMLVIVVLLLSIIMFVSFYIAAPLGSLPSN